MARKKEIEKKEKKNEEAYMILGGLVVLIILFFVFKFMFANWGKIEYNGLEFKKEMYGQIPVYRYTYYFPGNNNETIKYNLFLRGDPRKNKIPVEGEIELFKGSKIYVSINTTDLSSCRDSNVAIASLSAFLVNNQFEVRGAVAYKEEAQIRNMPFADCSSHLNNPVILVQVGSKSSVKKVGEMCYVLEAGNCEVMNVVEKFIVQSILDAKARAD